MGALQLFHHVEVGHNLQKRNNIVLGGGLGQEPHSSLGVKALSGSQHPHKFSKP